VRLKNHKPEFEHHPTGKHQLGIAHVKHTSASDYSLPHCNCRRRLKRHIAQSGLMIPFAHQNDVITGAIPYFID
jgi:hypothetical protein